MDAYIGIGHVDDLGEEIRGVLFDGGEDILNLTRVGEFLTGHLEPLLLDLVHARVLKTKKVI